MSCGKICVWITNVLFWGTIVFIIVAFCTDYTTLKILSIISISIVGIVYYSLTIFYSYFYYFPVTMTITKFYEYIDKMFKSMPLVNLNIICYHYYSSRGGRNREVTHERNEAFNYLSWRDTSGQLKLETSVAPCILLDLFLEVPFVDDGTMHDFGRAKNDFIARNNFNTHQLFTRTDKLLGFCKRILIQVTDKPAPLLGRGFFILFGLLTFNAAYTTYIDYLCHKQKMTIKKAISTRRNLDTPAIRRLNVKLNPLIVTSDQIIVFSPFKGPQVIGLDQPEAQQYLNPLVPQRREPVAEDEVRTEAPAAEFNPAGGHQSIFIPPSDNANRQ